ncbi:stage II sporulation protein M [Halomicroarcula sp. GCM10025709]|uniref:stage II sporulation protein M n=1 Tax=Halomicroarcula sp. GCM10025709 TaxID=3252669 RepID=UPI00360ABAA4
MLGLVLNGLLIGVVVGLAGQELPSMVILALLLPHGIVEIPALLIVAAIGLRFGRLTVRYLRGTEDRLVTEQALREAGWLVGVACVLVLSPPTSRPTSHCHRRTRRRRVPVGTPVSVGQREVRSRPRPTAGAVARSVVEEPPDSSTAGNRP